MYTMLGLEHLGLDPRRDHITLLVIGDPEAYNAWSTKCRIGGDTEIVGSRFSEGCSALVGSLGGVKKSTSA